MRVIRLYRDLERDSVGRILGRQLLRSGTSIGANLHEAKGGQTKADFVAKVSIAPKEALETLDWPQILQEDRTFAEISISPLIDETSQLIKILFSILLKSKRP